MEASMKSRWAVTAIGDSQLRATNSALGQVRGGSVVVVVSDGEATGRAVYIGEPVDQPRHAYTDREHNDVPPGPAYPSENAQIREIVIRDRQPWAVVILDVRVEECTEGRVAASARGRCAGGWMETPCACMCLLNCVELPVRGPREGCIGSSCEDD